MSAEKKDVGQVLKSEREKRSMTLEVVHEATKIPLDSLRAIEEGYKIRTLTTFYYKSFVKIYAQYLGLNTAEILALVPGSQSAPKRAAVEEAPKPKVVSSKPKAAQSKPFRVPAPELNLFAGPAKSDMMKKAAIIAGGVLAAVIVIFLVTSVIGSIRKHFAVQSALNSTKKKTSAKSAKPKSAPVKTVESAKPVAASTLPAAVPVQTVKTVETAKTVKTTTSEKTAEKPAQEPAPVAKVPKKASLTVRAPITVWLKVRVDGSTVYQGSLKKGNFESWSGSKRIEVSGKGIAQLELEVNGKTVGKLGRSDTNTKKIIVTPEGMSVEK